MDSFITSVSREILITKGELKTLIAYFFLTLTHSVLYLFLKRAGSAPLAAFLSFLPLLTIVLFVAYNYWPKGEGPRMFRFFQDFVLSIGAGMALYLSANIFLFFLVAMGLDSDGVFSTLLETLAIILFWTGYGFFFHYQKQKVQLLGMNWTEIESEDDPTVDMEHSSYDEIEEALHLLNLEPDLTEKTLKERYHELSLLYHPDRLNSMSEKSRGVAEREFKRIQSAYELLKISLKNERL